MTPQNDFLARRTAGEVIDGTVVSVVPFGAFVEVADGVHGLVHESEWRGPVPAPGTALRVEVLDVDVANARMSLRPA